MGEGREAWVGWAADQGVREGARGMGEGRGVGVERVGGGEDGEGLPEGSWAAGEVAGEAGEARRVATRASVGAWAAVGAGEGAARAAGACRARGEGAMGGLEEGRAGWGAQAGARGARGSASLAAVGAAEGGWAAGRKESGVPGVRLGF